MFALIVLACVACASAAPGHLVASPLVATPYASPLGAPLLSKVNIAPAQVSVVKQPYIVQQPELVYRNVPVPIKAVSYTAPQVIQPVVQHTPIVHHTPVVHHTPEVHVKTVHHAAPVAYSSGLVHHPVAYNHGVVGAHHLAYNHGYVH